MNFSAEKETIKFPDLLHLIFYTGLREYYSIENTLFFPKIWKCTVDLGYAINPFFVPLSGIVLLTPSIL
jgi:hypothetical protein